MKISLVALAASCAVASHAFAALDNPPAVPPNLAVIDNPPAVPPNVAVIDNPPAVPPNLA